MFSTKDYIDSKAQLSGRGRFDYLQALVTEFQDTDKHESKLQILANLANFAYDPINYDHLQKLNVTDLFLDMLTEEDEKMIEFGIGGICNSCLDKKNQNIIIENGGIESIIGCLSNSNEETVLNTITTLMFLINSRTKQDITTPAVIECIKKFSESSNSRIKNLACIFLEDYCYISTQPKEDKKDP